MRWFHRHVPQYTGRRITAQFTDKHVTATNPHTRLPTSLGLEAVCRCGAHLIVHLDHRFAHRFTELELELDA